MYVTDTDIFVHGGLGPNGKQSDLWSYSPSFNTWTKISQNGDMPPAFSRAGFSDFVHDSKKYFATSCLMTADYASDKYYVSDELYLYDVD